MPTEAARVPAPSTRLTKASADLDAEGGSLRVLRPRRAAPDHVVRPTRAEVDLTALRHNLRQLQRVAGPAKVWAVLKADGYGHGAPAVARTLERAGVDGVAVALLEEAIELRDAGIRAPILVMGGYYGDAYEELLAHDLVPVVYHVGHLQALARAARTRGLETAALRVHLKVDTGMARLGVRPRELPAMLEALAAFPQITVDGLMTHLACADAGDPTGDESVRTQLALFDEAVAAVRVHGHTPRWLHAGNSAALLRSGGAFDARYAAVRPGIALFGGVQAIVGSTVDLHPTLRLRSEVVDLRTLEPGEGVGYGHTFRAPSRADGRGTVIATVPMGYADGLPRTLSSKDGGPGFSLLVRGHRAPIVGAVSMDLVTLDVTDVPGVRLRDEVVALGAATPERNAKPGSRPASLGLEELARAAGLIPWDVMTSISRRVPRFYRT